jgi:Ser/Thr protein kinase RdoA (MazF antagonist)
MNRTDGPTRAALDRAREAWGLTDLAEVQFVANAVHRARRRGQTVYVRLSPAELRDRPEIEVELAFMAMAARHGVTVPRALPSAEGASVVRVDDDHRSWWAICLTELPGRLPDYDARVRAEPSRDWTRAHRVALGDVLGRLHRASRTVDASGRHHWHQDVVVPDGLDAALRDEWREVSAWLRSLPRPAGDYGLVHGDFLVGNYLLLDGDDVAVMDFDDCTRCWYAYDLAVSVYVLEHAPVIQALVRPDMDTYLLDLLEGYTRHTPISREWIDRIPGFVRFRRIANLVWCHARAEAAPGILASDWVRRHRELLARREPLR